MSGNKKNQRGGGSRRKRNQGKKKAHPLDKMGFGWKELPNRINGIELSVEITSNLNNSGVIPFARIYLNLTNPLLCNNGSATLVPFFSQWAAMYRKFRVRYTHVRADYVANEAFGVLPFLCPVNFQPTFATSAELQGYVSNIRGVNGLMSAKGGNDRLRLNCTAGVKDFAGFKNSAVDDPMVGNTDGTSPPANNIYMAVGTDNFGQASVLGTLSSLMVTFHIDFAERQTPGN